MKLVTAILFILSIYTINCAEHNSLVEPDGPTPSHVKHPTTKKPISTLPTNWSWSNVNGKNLVTLVRNHHIPNYCGGCYAFASTSVLSDRIKIARDGQWPDILISPQVLLSCSPSRGCHGGGPSTAYEYIRDFGITDESCSNYQAHGHENGVPCSKELLCSVCDENGKCHVPDSYPIYTVSEFGTVSGEKAMLNEIYNRGPIACSIQSSFIEEYTEGIIEETAPEYKFDHVVDVIGFGEEDGKPYWFVKNSWGSFWGQDGYFKVIRGRNSIGIEWSCGWAVPVDTWTKQVRNHTKHTARGRRNDFIDALTSSRGSSLKLDSSLEHYRDTSFTGEIPWAEVGELPTSWDWRNVDGVNYVSWTKSENSPNHCKASWVEATTSVLADRIMIARQNTFPEIALSVQAVINCHGGGDCSGGDPLAVIEFAYNHGIPEDSCQNYQAKNPDSFDCSLIQICKNCNPPAPFSNGTDPANCTGIEKYNNWKVSNWGTVSGVENMKKAILAEGPIACGIQNTAKFEQYEGGIFSQFSLSQVATHEVAVVGWDVQDGVEHWIVRNSWGSAWGELGFARVATGRNNLGIERACIWATPVIDKELISQ